MSTHACVQGVCESVLFGLPVVLRPTACWRLDWEELERNQHTFSALCRVLQLKVYEYTYSIDILPIIIAVPYHTN